MIRVLLVDDQELIRAGLRGILREPFGFQVVGDCEDGDQVLAAIAATDPAIVLMDVRMPRLDGIAATRLVHDHHPHLPVLALTTFDDDQALAGMLRAGAAGFVLKGIPADELHRAVRTVAAGDCWLDPAVTARVLTVYRTAPASPLAVDAGLEQLTERERDVLTLIGQGRTNTEIAHQLYNRPIPPGATVGLRLDPHRAAGGDLLQGVGERPGRGPDAAVADGVAEHAGVAREILPAVQGDEGAADLGGGQLAGAVEGERPQDGRFNRELTDGREVAIYEGMAGRGGRARCADGHRRLSQLTARVVDGLGAVRDRNDHRPVGQLLVNIGPQDPAGHPIGWTGQADLLPRSPDPVDGHPQRTQGGGRGDADEGLGARLGVDRRLGVGLDGPGSAGRERPRQPGWLSRLSSGGVPHHVTMAANVVDVLGSMSPGRRRAGRRGRGGGGPGLGRRRRRRDGAARGWRDATHGLRRIGPRRRRLVAGEADERGDGRHQPHHHCDHERRAATVGRHVTRLPPGQGPG